MAKPIRRRKGRRRIIAWTLTILIGRWMLSVTSAPSIATMEPHAPPAFVSPTPRCGSTLTAYPLNRFEITIAAIDPDPSESVRIEAAGPPPGFGPASADPSGGVTKIVDAWTPGPSQAGSTDRVEFDAVDMEGIGTSCAVTIRVPSIEYVALGDSFSSGEGVPDFIGGTKCHRSVSAYPLVFAAAVDIMRVRFAACSGAKIPNILNRGQHKEPRQLDALEPATTLITLTIGGNDATFGKTVFECVTLPRCDVLLGESTRRRIAGLQLALFDLYASIRASAKHAPIFVLGYPRLLTEARKKFQDCHGLGKHERRWIDSMGGLLDSVIQEAVRELDERHPDEPPIVFVPTAETFRTHEGCGESPWINPLMVLHHHEFSLHPNAAGQRALAMALMTAFRNIYPNP